MRKHFTNTKLFKTAVLALTMAVAGVVSVPAGAKDNPLTKSELKSLVTNAETKAEHERIAQYFDAEAVRYETEAKDHAELAPFYKKSPDPALSKHVGSPRAFEHCDALSKNLLKSAEEARNLAAEHRGMAHDAKK